MSFFPHVVVGAVVGSVSPNLGVALAGGLLSHFILDYIPHWDPVVNGKIPQGRKLIYGALLLIDVFLSLAVLILVFPYPKMFWASVAAAVIDIDNFLQYQDKFYPKLFPVLSKVGFTAHQPGSKWHKMTNIWLGLFNQGWVTALGLGLLYWQLTQGNF